jgi:hypothetical protein
VRQIRNAQAAEPLERAVDHVDGVRARDEVEERRRRIVPHLGLAFRRGIDDLAAGGAVELQEIATESLPTLGIDPGEAAR